nr:hypothetical protein [Tanacetum cinerariifolium]
MRMEQYFLMTDYSLWEVILNGDSPVPTRLVEGIVQPGAPTTAKQKLARKNELKARGTLLMAFLDEHQLKFNSHNDAKTLMEAIEKRFRVSDAASVSAVCAKMPVSSLPNVDSLNNAVIYSFFASQSFSPLLDNKDLKQIDVDDLEEMDLRWQMAMLTMRAKRFLQKTGINLGANGSTSMGFDMSKVECYNYHRKGHFAWECRSPKNLRRTGVAELQRRTVPVKTSTSNALVSQCDSVGSYDWSSQVEEEPANFTLMAFSASNSSSDTEVPSCSKACSKAYAQLHSQYDKLTDDFRKSQFDVISYQTGFNPVVGIMLPPLTTGTFMPHKPDLVFHTVPIAVETDHSAFTVQLSLHKTCLTLIDRLHLSLRTGSLILRMNLRPKPHRLGNTKKYASLTHPKLYKHMVPAAVLTQSKPVYITAVRPVSVVVPKIIVTRPRLAHPIVTKSKLPVRRYITRSQSPKTSNSPPRVTTVQALMVSVAQGMQGKWGNPQYALKDKGVIDSGYSRHMTGNMSYLSNFEELNGGYVAFGGNPKGGKISGKGKIKTGKQHRASCKTKPVSSIDQPIFRLHMDLFGPTFVKSLNKKSYFLVVTDDYSRSDNGTEFKNYDLNQFYGMKAIKREFSVPKTPQQNGIAERKNRTLIEAARTMLADSLLPIPFWAEAVNTACYVQNRVLVTKPHNKTPYELLHGQTLSISFMRPFGCPVTILNTLDSLGKFKRKVDKGFLVRYFVNSKAFRVFNNRTCIVQVTLHVNFLENKPNIARSGPTWLFDINSLTRTMNYQPVTARNQTNPSVGFQDIFDVEKAEEEINQQYVLFPVWSSGSTNPHNYDRDATFDGKKHDFDAKKPESEVILSPSSSDQSRKQDDKTKKEAKGKSPVNSFIGYRDLSAKFEDCSDNSSNEVNATGTIVPTVGQNSSNSTNPFSAAELEDITYSDVETDVGAKADFNNLKTFITVSPIPTTRVHKDHLVSQIIGDLSLTTQTRSMTRVVKDQGGLSQMFNDDFHTCMFARFLLQKEPTRVKQKKDGIFISQDKYVAEILRKFGLTEGISASTPIDTEKPLLKDPNGEDLLELMLSKRSKKNTKCVNAANEELTAAKHKLMLLGMLLDCLGGNPCAFPPSDEWLRSKWQKDLE